MRKRLKKFNKFVEHFSMKTIILFFLDAIVISLSFLFTVMLKNDFDISFDMFNSVVYELPIVILIYWITFEFFQMYKSLWEFASFEEVIKGVTASGVATIAAYLLVSSILDNHFSLTFYMVAWFLVTFSTLFVRMFYRIFTVYKSFFESKVSMKKALIVGAGGAGVLVFKEVNIDQRFNSKVIGFVDDDERKIGRTIHSVPVLGKIDEIDLLIVENEIDIVYVAIPKANKAKIARTLNLIEKTGAQIKLFPPFYEMMSGENGDRVKLRDINIEDLLGRDPIVLEEDGIKEYIDSKAILVTGGGGSIGSELCRQLRKFNPSKIVILDIYENNAYDLQMEFERLYRKNVVKHKPEIVVLIASVRDEQRLDEIFEEYKPHVVFHAAAHKHVPLMEVSPKEAIKNNVFGTYKTAKMAIKHNVEKFVLISTDKAVNPTNIMGATKRMAERIVMELDKESKTDFAAVRFGNVLGSNGSVIPLFKKQIEDGGPLTVTHPDIIRYFMTIPEACQLVIQAGAYAKGGELFVLDMGDQVKILDLAEKVIRLSGLEPYKEIEIQFTGLRPGEKMFEELLVDYSTTLKTNNNRIYIEPNDINREELIIDEIKEIRNAIKGNNEVVISLVKKYVNTYIKD